MTQSTRIYKHSAAGTDWAALALGAGLGLTLALQATTMRSGDFEEFYSVVVTVSRLAALVGTYLSVIGIFLVALMRVSGSSGLPLPILCEMPRSLIIKLVR
jgi:hypothetical protein